MKVYPYHVRPNLPERLEPLRELAHNYWFSWNWQAVQVFIRIDPVLWEETYQNPVAMLARLSQERLDELAQDDSFVANLQRVAEILPLTPFLELVRATYLDGDELWDLPGQIAAMGAWGILGFVVAATRFRWAPVER